MAEVLSHLHNINHVSSPSLGLTISGGGREAVGSTAGSNPCGGSSTGLSTDGVQPHGCDGQCPVPDGSGQQSLWDKRGRNTANHRMVLGWRAWTN